MAAQGRPLKCEQLHFKNKCEDYVGVEKVSKQRRNEVTAKFVKF